MIKIFKELSLLFVRIGNINNRINGIESNTKINIWNQNSLKKTKIKEVQLAEKTKCLLEQNNKLLEQLINVSRDNNKVLKEIKKGVR